jgi:trimeric autotransporter adhesin
VSAHARHLVRTIAIALAVSAVGLLLAVTGASAYVTGHGSGSASASVTTLAAPAIARTSAGAASVTLTWSAVSAPAAGSVTYYVSRDGGAASAACPSAASPSAVTSCTDTGVSTAAHSYTVTAVWRTWTHASAAANVTVAYGPATQLVFTTQPGGSATGGVAFPTQPVVTARDASGNTVADYSGSVTLAIASGTGTAGATLSGCSGTLANGVTTFSGCAIDKSGTTYRLRASDRALTVDSSAFAVSVGATARLAFTTQPGGGATGGSTFPTQPVVTAQDAGGNTVTGFSGTVTLSIVSGTGTSGATLSSCSGSRSNGVTTFSSCEIDKAGTGYQLHASATGGLRGDSSTFDVSVGAVSEIAFTTQPGGGATGGLAFPTQPVVTARDAGGNVVTSYSRTIVLSIVKHTGNGNGTLSGCTSSLSSGVTTFAGCEIDLTGADYQLSASDGSRSDTSDAFAVTVGPAAQLDFTSSPGTSTAGSAFGSQPVVAAEDAGGNAVTTYAGTVTLSVGAGSPAGTLSGCTSSRRSGVTTFSGCKLDRSGSYTLHASDGSIAGDSSSFTVNPGTATTLAFTTQPVDALINTSFPTAPVVTALDALGNVATSYANTVTLSIKSGTGTAGASLSNCTASLSSGATTFRSCRISRTGSGYVLRATDSARTPLTVDSTAFNVR